MVPQTKLLVGTKEAADLLGISPSTIYRLVALKRLKTNGSMRHLKFTPKELERFAESISK